MTTRPPTNTFGVLRADGSPRTFYKPKEGIKYWETQYGVILLLI
jgi:pyocin large subunit-like protein